jgi:hypothetical protein
MAGVRKGVSVAAILAVGLLGAAAWAGEDPATRLAAPDATGVRTPGDERARPHPSVRHKPPPGGGEVGAASTLATAPRPSELTTLRWLERFGRVETRPASTETDRDLF